jgi:hypothetical protein
MQQEITDIHPYLEFLPPIAIVDKDELYIFDVDSSRARYSFQKKDTVPFPMQKGIRASFPLSTYGGKPSCVVSPEVFDERKDYPTIFHEFIHCAQFRSVEPELKQHLEVAQEAARKNNVSWEITYPFPYQDSIFVKQYSALLKALERGDGKGIDTTLRALKQHLGRTDYEYMVWEEWKEGFARFIENKIRARIGVPTNQEGSGPPFDRVTFYHGGELLIRFLTWHDKDLLGNTKGLFEKMRDGRS